MIQSLIWVAILEFLLFFAARKAIKGRVIAFEPVKDNYDMLMANLELNDINNAFAENIAIANDNGTRTFHLSSFEANNSVGYVTGGHSLYSSKDHDQQIEVQTATLESVVKKYNIDKIDYLKLDTEGAEFEILLSTPMEIIKKIQQIVMELHPF